MALTIDKIPAAVSGVLEAIADGVEIAADLVDVAEPPERVSFNIEAIAKVNGLERTTTITNNPALRTETTGAQVSEQRLFLDGVLTQINLVTVGEATRTTESSPVITQRTAYEDEAVGVSFDVPGPGFSPNRNAIAATF